MYLIFMLTLLYPRLIPLWIVLGIFAHESFLFLIPSLYLYHTLRGSRWSFSGAHAWAWRLSSVCLSVVAAFVIRVVWRHIWHCEAFPVSSYLFPIFHDPFIELRSQAILGAGWASYECAAVALVLGSLYACSDITEKKGALLLVATTFFAVVFQLMIAHDTTRLMSSGFFVILLIPALLRGFWGANYILAATLLGCIITPSWYIGSDWSFDLEQGHKKTIDLVFK